MEIFITKNYLKKTARNFKMKTMYKKFIAIFAGLIIMAGCGKDSTTGPDDGPEDFTGTSTITGKVVAPDGSTPISGATVYVPNGSPKTIIPQVSVSGQTGSLQAACTEPPEAASAKTCTEADGSFQFDVPIESGKVTLKVKKGVFTFSATLDVSGPTASVGNVQMPDDTDALSAKIAVVTGAYDRMQDILAKLGFGELDAIGQLELGTEQFDLYNGDFSLPESYPEYVELFEDRDGDGEPDMNNYDIVFFNCGADEFPLEESNLKQAGHQHGKRKTGGSSTLLDQADIDALRAYVENGGTLYVTDLAYDYVEQAFPEFIDYHGSDTTAAADPEPLNLAEVGEDGITTEATILDSDLRSWMEAVSCEAGSCLNGDGTVHVAGFLSGWAVIDGQESGSTVNFSVKGTVSWYHAGTFNLTSGAKVLTAEFPAGSGKVIYSSYHTVEEDPSPGWKPQERILQYLVFE